MLFFGGETLKDFAFAMAVGLVTGAYSSIAIATPLFTMWKSREAKNRKLIQKFGPEIGAFTYAASTRIARPAGAATSDGVAREGAPKASQSSTSSAGEKKKPKKPEPIHYKRKKKQ